MNKYKRFNLMMAVILISAAFSAPARSATPSGVRSTHPDELHSVPGATADWWAAVQEDLRQSGYHVTQPMSGIAGLSLVPDWQAVGNQEDALFGYSVGAAGDVNGDGYDDVIIGIVGYSNGQSGEGAAVVFHGSAFGLSLVHDWLVESNEVYIQFGSSVGTAGDVNGDGYSDVIIGAPFYDNGQNAEGAAAVYHGSASGLSLIAAWLGEGDQENAFFGRSVGTAGDINGDGYADVIVGAPDYTNGQYLEGAAAVYYGSASGLALIPNWGDEGDREGAHFGNSVGTAGDVNGDGYDDVIVGAPNWNNGQEDEGGAALYYGSASGLPGIPNWTVESNMQGAEFGNSVSTARDVNGDGYDDVIIGAHYYAYGQVDEGGAVVYQGSASGLSHIPNWGDESDQEGARFGWSVSTAGDVNGDGYADVIVGAFFYDYSQTDEGEAVVYHGGDNLFRLYLPLVLRHP